MPSSELILFAFAVVVLLILIRWVRRARLVASDKAWRPWELQDAELVYAEQVFKANGPVTLVAKVDRGYRDMRGVITLVELKTRRVDRPYLSDVIELSAQRSALAAQTQGLIATHGYVLVQQPGSGRRTLHRVQLLTHEEVISLAKRREAILANRKEAQYASSSGLCEQCAFRQQCKPPLVC